MPTTMRPGVLATIDISATPHPCLSPNDTAGWRKKAAARRTLKDAAFLAARDWLATNPGKAAEIRPALRLDYTVCWEPGRQAWDADNLGAALKGATDGIARALWVDDAAFAFGPVCQVRLVHGQGFVRCVVSVAGSPAGGDGR